MVQKVNLGTPTQSTCSCRLPTTQKEEVADRAKSFGSVPVAVAVAPRTGANYSSNSSAAAATSFPHKICLIKIFVKISKLFCCVGSLEMSSNSVSHSDSSWAACPPVSASSLANSWRNKILPPTMKLLNNWTAKMCEAFWLLSAYLVWKHEIISVKLLICVLWVLSECWIFIVISKYNNCFS